MSMLFFNLTGQVEQSEWGASWFAGTCRSLQLSRVVHFCTKFLSIYERSHAGMSFGNSPMGLELETFRVL
jgi:hypothetical protein